MLMTIFQQYSSIVLYSPPQQLGIKDHFANLRLGTQSFFWLFSASWFAN
ncbi:MAG: hypothetical protein OFPI_43360 [Osedax symbiont Rs2]|nr:MAG: hypothetical protein OFPI_43360 [Osedax symbiont Rs2]